MIVSFFSVPTHVYLYERLFLSLLASRLHVHLVASSHSHTHDYNDAGITDKH